MLFERRVETTVDWLHELFFAEIFIINGVVDMRILQWISKVWKNYKPKSKSNTTQKAEYFNNELVSRKSFY